MERVRNLALLKEFQKTVQNYAQKLFAETSQTFFFLILGADERHLQY